MTLAPGTCTWLSYRAEMTSGDGAWRCAVREGVGVVSAEGTEVGGAGGGVCDRAGVEGG